MATLDLAPIAACIPGKYQGAQLMLGQLGASGAGTATITLWFIGQATTAIGSLMLTGSSPSLQKLPITLTETDIPEAGLLGVSIAKGGLGLTLPDFWLSIDSLPSIPAT